MRLNQTRRIDMKKLLLITTLCLAWASTGLADDTYLGKLSTNPYDPDSTSNPYGRYGSKYSPDSINNPYGAGSPYKVDSPNNPYGEGISIYGDDDG